VGEPISLGEALNAASAVLERPLADDEVLVVGRLVDAGRGLAEITATFANYERPPEVDDDGVAIHRYEQGFVDGEPQAVEF